MSVWAANVHCKMQCNVHSTVNLEKGNSVGGETYYEVLSTPYSTTWKLANTEARIEVKLDIV